MFLDKKILMQTKKKKTSWFACEFCSDVVYCIWWKNVTLKKNLFLVICEIQIGLLIEVKFSLLLVMQVYFHLFFLAKNIIHRRKSFEKWEFWATGKVIVGLIFEMDELKT